ncbi:yrdC domain-containing protein, mitochondrial [Nasonia vitripennis]|uniref:Threonylcarbamoyl-AMP synthase n=1 Tax=Nasonia vitripennis TaxID=7425 RepID=A0A7M7QP09_NASVI|nr:yrdC domain-containing protein, mitochondrial [Nasonia vitripennis]
MRLLAFLRSRITSPNTMGPIKSHLLSAKKTITFLPENKQWFCGGHRSAAVAAELLRNGKIVAMPTDTIYGLAGLAQNDASVARLYEIKKRDESKPLAICLWDVDDIENWAHVEDLPDGLLQALLPGPTTLVLKRKSSLNPHLNPGVENVGIRIPKYDFIRSVVKMLNQPIALTSANESNAPSSLHPEEFQSLWPELDGVFYEKMNLGTIKESWRRGSTVVDLTVAGQFSILRRGIGYQTTFRVLREHQLTYQKNTKNVAGQGEEDSEDESKAPEEMKARASG